MKKIFIIVLSSLLIVVAHGQDKKRFDYKPSNFGNSIVTPTFEKTKGEGNFGQATVLDRSYLNDLFYDAIKEVFSKQKFEILHLGSSVIVSFNSKGEILNCKFIIDDKDKYAISEEELYNLYLRLKKVKMDMTKIKIDDGGIPSNVKAFDYSEMIFSLVPMEYRDAKRKKVK